MVREKKKASNKAVTQQQDEQNPETKERTRLKRVAYTNQIISESPAKGLSPLTPSKTIIKHHGKDILKKSQRKSRYLFSFSGLLAPISGGKIGELTDLRSKNPILYLEFPQGRMKLFGTIVYPKNRYLTLQFSRGGKNVICEDCFDTMIVFSEGYWVGKKDENPDEARLEFPEELYETRQSEFDFQGGAGSGAAAMQNRSARKSVAKSTNEESSSDSPLDDMETESPERQANLKDLEYATPMRHSERTAGKRFKFTDVSSRDDSPESDESAKANEEAADEANNEAAENDQSAGISETAAKVRNSEDIQLSTVQAPLSSMLSSGEKQSSRSSLVQATISTLFKKVEQKSTAEEMVKIVPNKVSQKISQQNSSKSQSKSMLMQLVPEAAELPTEENISQVRKEGTRSNRKKRKAEVTEVEDDIEEFSSASEVDDESDDDWRA